MEICTVSSCTASIINEFSKTNEKKNYLIFLNFENSLQCLKFCIIFFSFFASFKNLSFGKGVDLFIDVLNQVWQLIITLLPNKFLFKAASCFWTQCVGRFLSRIQNVSDLQNREKWLWSYFLIFPPASPKKMIMFWEQTILQ